MLVVFPIDSLLARKIILWPAFGNSLPPSVANDMNLFILGILKIILSLISKWWMTKKIIFESVA